MAYSKEDTVEYAGSLTAENEFVKAMDVKKRGDEPLVSAKMVELLCQTEKLAKQFVPKHANDLRELSAGWRELVLAGYALAAAYTSRTGNGVEELLGHAPEGAVWRAENLRLTRAAEQMADAAPDVLPLSDRWDDLATLALVLGQRQ